MRRSVWLSLLLCACGSDSRPTVEIVEVTPQLLDPSDDAANDVTLVVAYSDGDGDLGEGVARIYDCRGEELVTKLELPPIANGEALEEGVAIDGELRLLLADVAHVVPTGSATCEGFGAPEIGAGQTALCVVLSDAAGHESEADCSEVIALAEP